MKKHKLYTVNKWNKPAFGNMFEGGGLFEPQGYTAPSLGGTQFGANTPASNLFSTPQLTNPNSTAPRINWGSGVERSMALGQSNALTDAAGKGFNMSLTDSNKQLSSDLSAAKGTDGSEKSRGSSFNMGAGLMGAASAIGDIPTGDPRGLWDTADPVYHLAGGRESAAGNVMSDAGVQLTKTGLSSGQPWLAVAGAGLKIIGGLTNAMFGIKENKENTNFIKQNTQNAMKLSNQLASASSNEDLINRASKMVGGSSFDWNDLYQNGWFTSKGTRLGKNLIAKENTALAIQRQGLNTGARNVDTRMDENVMRNFAAFGGPLEQMSMTPGAIGYGFMSDYLNNKRQQIEANDTMTNTFAGAPSTMFAEGGGIHIKPSHKGRLTELKKRTGKTEAELYNDGNPAHKKMVVFARNARKWSHADGGPLFAFGGVLQSHGSDWGSGLVHIDAGGMHEENKYDGVQLGKDMNSVPNLVEEGEVVFDDYVYSNRISCDETTKQKFHIGKKKDITYADLAKKLEKEISERPNDAISQAGFSALMHQLAEQQERQKQEAEAKRAKEAFEALSPEEQEAIIQQAAQEEQIAQEAIQQQNLQEQAEVEQQAVNEGPSEEELAALQQQEAQVEPIPEIHAQGGPIHKHYIINEDGTKSEIDEKDIEGLIKEEVTDKDVDDNNQTIYSHYYKKPLISEAGTEVEESTKTPSTKAENLVEKELEEAAVTKARNERLKYAGLFGPATGLAMMAAGVGKPDYTYLENAVTSLNNPATATYTPLGDYLRYTPMDIWAEQNKMNANARATDRVIANSNNPAKMAGLLANSYNTQLASGDLYRKALEYNDAKRAQVADFNRATNLQNSQMGSHTSQFNAEAINRNAQHQAALAMQAAKERLDSDASWYNSLYGNINNFYKGLSELGRDNAIWNIASAVGKDVTNLGDSNIAKLYRKNGGKIKKKNGKRGLTY